MERCFRVKTILPVQSCRDQAVHGSSSFLDILYSTHICISWTACIVLSTVGIITPSVSQLALDSCLALLSLLNISRTTFLTGWRIYLSILLWSTPISNTDSETQGLSASTEQLSAQVGATHMIGHILVAFFANRLMSGEKGGRRYTLCINLC